MRQSQPSRTVAANRTAFPITKLRVAPAASQQIMGRRWYSSKEESEKKEEEMLKQSPEAKPEQDAAAKEDAAKEDPIAKELEAEKKKNLDLSV